MTPLRFLAIVFLTLLAAPAQAQTHQPNILWISSEDHGPHMGCYGDRYATTPNVDRLAAKGMIYLHCWSCAPVCAPARITIISGMYPPCTGAEHSRDLLVRAALGQQRQHVALARRELEVVRPALIAVGCDKRDIGRFARCCQTQARDIAEQCREPV